MFNNEYKTLGMLICGVAGTFQKKLCQELTIASRKLGYNLAIFNAFGGYSYEDIEPYTVGESNIINLPPYEKFDGMIVVPDTFANEALRKRVIAAIKKRVSCPVVSIRTGLDGCYNLLVDNTVAMDSMVSHFIEHHGLTKIAFVGGPKGHPDADSRLLSFRNTMERYNIPVREDWIVHGSFWVEQGPKHVDYFFSKDKSEWPEAVICANDYMAIAICDECLERGIRVPDEVLVSGFDNLPETLSCYPLMTTVEVSVSDIAEKCVNTFKRLEEGEHVDSVQYISTRDIYRASCGCNSVDIISVFDGIKALRNDYVTLFNSARNSTYMSVCLQKLEEVENIKDILESDKSKFRSLIICISERGGRNGSMLAPRIKGYPKKIRCIYGHFNRNYFSDSVFYTEELIPSNVDCNEPVQFYFSPLHYQDKTYGYIVHSYDDDVCYDKAFQNWMAIMGNAFENIFTKKKYAELVDELNNQYVHESMTGLYNRRGFDTLSQEMYERSVKERTRVMLIEVDMDNLKGVNDMYGHSEGDKVIDIIAGALKKAASHGEICARVGGDEFWVAGYDYDKYKMDEYIQNLKRNIEELDAREVKPYSVEVSYGAVLTDPMSGITLEEYINLVDARMYRNKRERKKKKDNFEE